MSSYDEIDLSRITTITVTERGSKVTLKEFGNPVKGGKAFARWLGSLPDQLAVKRLKDLVLAMRRAVSGKEREIIWLIGAHVVKCGLSLYLIELMKKGYITAIAMNGAALIHDLEIAFFGETSEDVVRNLREGIFGFSGETARISFEAVSMGSSEGMGLGESFGAYLLKSPAPNRGHSILAEAFRLKVPVTVHIAIGTDIINQHPGFDGAVWGELSAKDFRIFSKRVECLGINGGVVLNVGSAVILPEVFLKAFSIARNLGCSFDGITTCNMDMIQHYRPNENVLRRPSGFGGKAVSLTGHHEIMIPLLYSTLLS
ncbi:MAG: hypothetical protein KAX38_09535 [Candidatus Krumholzibacteria bacterium]|nr:hypothetical protein [Candidatus Krumholzibacteria bacterium]